MIILRLAEESNSGAYHYEFESIMGKYEKRLHEGVNVI